MSLDTAIAAQLPHLVEIRHGLHQIPELGYQEFKTAVDQIREAHDAGPLGSGETMWPGTYAVPEIDLVNTSLGLLGAVTDPSGLSAPSVGIVALPPFVPSGTSSTPIFVLTTAFMEHVASVIGMPFATMMSQGVALIHVVESDGVTPANNQQLFWLHGIPVGTLQPGFYPSASLTELPFSATMTSAPYVYYLSSDLNGVIFDNNGAVSTSSSGLVVVVGPPPLLSTASGSQYEMAYTSEESGEGTFVVFGVQPNAVVDVLLPDQ